MKHEAKDAGVSRKDFLGLVLRAGAGGLTLAAVYPVSRYVIPPLNAESSVSSVVLSLKPADLAPGTGQIFKFGTSPGIIIRTPDGQIRAFSAICTHLSCTVQFREDIGHIWCACHNGHFDLNGRNIAGPPPAPLVPFEVKVRGDQILVTRQVGA
ncbi:MAG TPA: Rieske (2Fe-2S) protein [Longimicrobiales bacterium]|nr:Rieske (2Fe-2S) protein [Longimicrobiales bacterium]